MCAPKEFAGAEAHLHFAQDAFKARRYNAAADHLRRLSGKRHQLVSAAVLLRDGQRIWGRTDRASLVVRTLSEDFIAAYLDAVGNRALESVGAYQLEGLGVNLFRRVDGDFFTVLGLPLLPLLDFLRVQGALDI